MKNFTIKKPFLFLFVMLLFGTLDAQVALTINLEDSYGDGWNGADILIVDNSVCPPVAFAGPFTITTGFSGTEAITLDDNKCYIIDVLGGSFPGEVSWTITFDSDGTTWASGGAPEQFSMDLGVPLACNVLGCTDPTAPNFDPMATCDDGSCAAPAPGNDLCADATVLTCGSALVGESSESSTDQSADVGCTMGAGVWYTFVGTGDDITLALTNDAFDAEIALATGACGALTNVSCTDLGTTAETVEFSSVAGTVYYFYIGDWSGGGSDGGTFDLALTCVVPPTCPDPTAVTATNVTETTVDVAWTTGGSATDATVTVCPDGIAPGDASCIVVASATNPQTVTGLSSTTAYDVYVQEACGAEMSVIVGPTSFTTLAPAPVNDECAAAIDLTVNGDELCGSVTPGTIAGATASGVDEVTCSGTEDDDVWFSFTATAATHTIDLLNPINGTTDLYHSLWTGTCAGLTNTGLCSDPNSSTATGLTIGTIYYLRVYSWISTTGQTTEFDVCIGTPAPPPAAPANDECADATELICGSVLIGETTVSGTDNDDLGCFIGVGVWYTFAGTGDEVTIDITNDDVDVEVGVGTGACGALTNASCTDGGITSETVTFTSVVGTTYYIYVGYFSTFGGNTGTFDLALTCVAPLPIELASFTGKTMSTTNMLEWVTASEENTEWHVIERSKDGRSAWSEVARTEAKGFSNELISYQLEDAKPMAKSYYRLRSIDFDGHEDFSDVIYLERYVERFDIVKVYPVPTSKLLNIDFETVQDQKVVITMTDMLGKVITTRQMNSVAGINTATFEMSNLANGVYFVTLNNGQDKLTKRIVKN